LPDDVKRRLNPSCMLRDDDDRALRLRDLATDPYFDPVLKGSPELYCDSLIDLHVASMIRWDLDAKAEAAPFLVSKSDGGDSVRSLFDGRVPNCPFFDPPSIDLLSGEGLTHGHVPTYGVLWGSGYDVVDYYNGARTPDWIACRFGLPHVDLSLLEARCKLKGIDPPPFRGDGFRAQACLAVLPQGWTWSVYLAQKAHEHLIHKGSDSPLLSDQKHDHVFVKGEVAAMAYFEDGGAMGVEEDLMNAEHESMAVKWLALA